MNRYITFNKNEVVKGVQHRATVANICFNDLPRYCSTQLDVHMYYKMSYEE